jgi:hypothetical protein
MDRSVLIHALSTTPGRLAALLQELNDARTDAAPPGEWSVRTVAAHLRDDEFLVTRLRVERMLAEDHPALVPFDEQRWAETRSRDREALHQIAEDFAAQRAATLNILRRLDDEAWRRPGTQPEIGTFDVHHWVEHIHEHDENHLAQIATLLGQ